MDEVNSHLESEHEIVVDVSDEDDVNLAEKSINNSKFQILFFSF